MNSIQLKLLAPEVTALEDNQGSCGKCIDGFFDIIEKVCTAVANFFTTIIRYICCCIEEEFPDGPEVIVSPKIPDPIIPVDPIEPIDPIVPVIPPEPTPPVVLPEPPKPPVVITPNPVPVVKLAPDFRMEYPVPLIPKELPKPDLKIEEPAIAPLPEPPIQPSVVAGDPRYKNSREQIKDDIEDLLDVKSAWRWKLSFDPSKVNVESGTEYSPQIGDYIDRDREPLVVEYIPELGVGTTHYMGPKCIGTEPSIINNCDLLNAEDFIKLIEDYKPDPHTPIIKSTVKDKWLDRLDLDIALDEDPEVTYKRQVARLALVWVAAKRNQFTATEDINHPFEEIFESLRNYGSSLKDDKNGRLPLDKDITLPYNHSFGKDCSYTCAKKTIIGFQELTRILPLIKVFAAQKKKVQLEHKTRVDFVRGRRGRTFKAEADVNYLRDVVQLMTHGFMRLKTYSPLSSYVTLQEKDYFGKPMELDEVDPETKVVKKTSFKKFPVDGLNADKVVQSAELFWKAYNKAKEKDDLESFFESISHNECFDAKMSHLMEYYQKIFAIGVNKDFELDGEKLRKGDFDAKVMEYRRVFANEQMANFIYGKVPVIKYSDFQKIIAAAPVPVNTAELKDFYTNYATNERFRSWLHTKNTQPGNTLSKINVLEDADWEKIVDSLENGACGFDDWL